jgi:hypothetical protein
MMEMILPLIVFFVISFGCFYLANTNISAGVFLLCILVVLTGIIFSIPWGGLFILVLFFEWYTWIPVLIFGSVMGWIFRPDVKEKW